MKNYTTPIENYRAALKGFAQVNLLSFKVRDRTTNAKVWFHFSSRDYDESITVTSQGNEAGYAAGDAVLRAYYGDGQIIQLDPIVRGEGTGIRNFSLTLSAVSTAVQDMVQGYDCRDAVFEWHIGEAEEGTGLLVDTPVCEFEGFVDTVDRDDDAINDDGSPANSVFRISVVDHKSTLQRANPDMRTIDVCDDRTNDAIFKYADESNTWLILWGKEGKGGGKGGDGRDKVKGDPETWGHR